MGKVLSLTVRFLPRPMLQRLSNVATAVLAVYLKGEGLVCPVCNGHYRRFLPYGRLRSRKNALCPGCQSLERHRLIWLYLQEKTDFFTKSNDVLHIAPENCFMDSFRSRHGNRYVTADIESPLADVKMDIHKMPFGDQQFDFVLCNHVLEHVDDDLIALREIKRVLKPGGKAILQVPFFKPVPDKTFSDAAVTDPREREKLFGQSDHIRRYGLDYAERIRSVGLNVMEEPFGFKLATEAVERYALVPETIFVATK
ncbi:MAG: methyltransferase domain-containing protein [Bacteroidetes bacterium]|nr:methyltransferase domain-containing protein [Bacteroidota bacterium]